MSFTIDFLNTMYCDRPESADEGVELSMRNPNGNNIWVPLRYYHDHWSGVRRNEIYLGPVANTSTGELNINIRGYDVPIEIFTENNLMIEICDSTYLKHKTIQFRWLQTLRFLMNRSRSVPVDVWSLDNIVIEYINGSLHKTLLNETFDSEQLK